ncbi:PAS modulated sigma54 specific transcriptional regulator, Fis family [Candidatus Moduliflexus flocculans]|uniref:PAS modulated sigma54 specific transcriptional regulator, Fis family n=1 Tax=Candidatus Moduliflexus flocculans TaxID=1499966 RepID=A0A0S6VQZ9_9BACT|nr:PAS modulated sigma54 specific transcriptional regulator, Fis family [Candidatus Moduliflexus flocculans]
MHTQLPSPESSRPQIVVVDDMPANLRLLTDMLTKAGYLARPALNGKIALSSIRLNPPDVVLLDIVLPDISGYEVCQQLKADPNTSEIPIIFISAKTELFEKIKGFELGAVDYVGKPFEPQEVLLRVQTHVTIRRLQLQLQAQNLLLQEQNLRFRTLVEATLEGIILHDQGRIIDANQRAFDLFDTDRETMIEAVFSDFISEPFRASVAAMLTTNAEYPLEIEGQMRNGAPIPLEIYARRMAYQGRDIQIAVLRDLSWKKRIEAENTKLQRENLALKATNYERYRLGPIIGKSRRMQEVYELIAAAAASEFHVVISGESGTGKELVARTIHALSSRTNQPFVPVNCGAVTETIFEREFFGHRKGAFTGADRNAPGYFDAADQGTLFLDEIGELSFPMQVKLLRVLENREFTPVGGTMPRRVDARILAATNKRLPEMVRDGQFREDLFYRLHVMEIVVPPLRERREDIPLLLEALLQEYAPETPLPSAILDAFMRYDWPGNIREMQNRLQRYLATGRIDIPSVDLPPASTLSIAPLPPGIQLHDAVETLEAHLIRETLIRNKWRRVKTAEELGIPRRTLQRKVEKYGIFR